MDSNIPWDNLLLIKFRMVKNKICDFPGNYYNNSPDEIIYYRVADRFLCISYIRLLAKGQGKAVGSCCFRTVT